MQVWVSLLARWERLGHNNKDMSTRHSQGNLNYLWDSLSIQDIPNEGLWLATQQIRDAWDMGQQHIAYANATFWGSSYGVAETSNRPR
jgi:hypothetical protein